jgi:hypothetical protein
LYNGAVLFLIAAVLILILFSAAGCATKPKAKNEIQSSPMLLPPMPRQARSSPARESVSEATAIGPVAPPRLTLIWDKNDLHPETVTEIWASTNLKDWAKVGEASEPRFEVWASERQQFFKIRNRLGAELSDWARK